METVHGEEPWPTDACGLADGICVEPLVRLACVSCVSCAASYSIPKRSPTSFLYARESTPLNHQASKTSSTSLNRWPEHGG